MIRFRRGISLLNKVVRNFENAVVDLDVAVEQIEAKRQQVLDQIDELQAKEDELFFAKHRATTVRANIAELIGA